MPLSSTPACTGPTAVMYWGGDLLGFNPRVYGADHEVRHLAAVVLLQPPRVRGRLYVLTL